ncbi:MAG: TVP38/TMEM64 family protein [Pseudohongiella sp.]|uniref:TVP38/TMEM64 family protein n=1 Tax=Pseudohongiella sp. TaxID=1979412 RepID=UPI0034A0A593
MKQHNTPEEQTDAFDPVIAPPPGWKVKASASAIVVILILLLWLLLRDQGMPQTLSAPAIADWLNGLGYRGPLLLSAMMIIAVVVGPIPTLPISAASGLAFGLVGGTLVAAVGALLGAMIAFWTARLLGRDVICRYLPGNPLFARQQSQWLLFWAIFMTRLIPLFSFALVSYAAGVTSIRAWQFALASFVGMLPMTVVFAGLGNTLEMHPVLTVSAAVLLLLAMTVLPYYFNRRCAR